MLGSAKTAAARLYGLQADLLLDFKNGVYQKDGTSGSITDIGGTNTGTITGGVGLTCTGTQVMTIPYNFTGPFIMVVDHDAINDANHRIMASLHRNSSNNLTIQGSGTFYAVFYPPSSILLQTKPYPGKTVAGYQGTTAKVAQVGEAVTTGSSGATPDFSTATTLYVGNGAGSSNVYPCTTVIRSVAIYRGTFTDAEIAAFVALPLRPAPTVTTAGELIQNSVHIGVVPLAGVPIRILGTHLNNATSVTIGGTAVTGRTFTPTDGVIACTAPAKAAGTYDLVVTTPSGTSTLVNAIRYAASGAQTDIRRLIVDAGYNGGAGNYSNGGNGGNGGRAVYAAGLTISAGTKTWSADAGEGANASFDGASANAGVSGIGGQGAYDGYNGTAPTGGSVTTNITNGGTANFGVGGVGGPYTSEAYTGFTPPGYAGGTTGYWGRGGSGGAGHFHDGPTAGDGYGYAAIIIAYPLANCRYCTSGNPYTKSLITIDGVQFISHLMYGNASGTFVVY